MLSLIQNMFHKFPIFFVDLIMDMFYAKPHNDNDSKTNRLGPSFFLSIYSLLY